MTASAMLGLARPLAIALIVVGCVAAVTVLWILGVWRPRHRRRQEETARYLFGGDETDTWHSLPIDQWSADERDTALRYYNTAGRQARIGGIRAELVPPRHAANIVELSGRLDEDDQRWDDLRWLAHRLGRDDRARGSEPPLEPITRSGAERAGGDLAAALGGPVPDDVASGGTEHLMDDPAGLDPTDLADDVPAPEAPRVVALDEASRPQATPTDDPIELEIEVEIEVTATTQTDPAAARADDHPARRPNVVDTTAVTDDDRRGPDRGSLAAALGVAGAARRSRVPGTAGPTEPDDETPRPDLPNVPAWILEAREALGGKHERADATASVTASDADPADSEDAEAASVGDDERDVPPIGPIGDRDADPRDAPETAGSDDGGLDSPDPTGEATTSVDDDQRDDGPVSVLAGSEFAWPEVPAEPREDLPEPVDFVPDIDLAEMERAAAAPNDTEPADDLVEAPTGPAEERGGTARRRASSFTPLRTGAAEAPPTDRPAARSDAVDPGEPAPVALPDHPALDATDDVAQPTAGGTGTVEHAVEMTRTDTIDADDEHAIETDAERASAEQRAEPASGEQRTAIERARRKARRAKRRAEVATEVALDHASHGRRNKARDAARLALLERRRAEKLAKRVKQLRRDA